MWLPDLKPTECCMSVAEEEYADIMTGMGWERHGYRQFFFHLFEITFLFCQVLVIGVLLMVTFYFYSF